MSKKGSITSTGKIKSCTIKPECADIRFDGLQFSPAQYERLADLCKAEDEVEINITPMQGRLPLEK